MPKKKKTIKAGVGTQCSILTKFLRPAPFDIDSLEDGHRSNVVLVGEKTVAKNRKEMKWYTCTIIGWENKNQEFWAATTQFKKEEEGPVEGFFTPLTKQEKEDRRQIEASEAFVEPKIKWNPHSVQIEFRPVRVQIGCSFYYKLHAWCRELDPVKYWFSELTLTKINRRTDVPEERHFSE